jgi:hypothetical protein
MTEEIVNGLTEQEKEIARLEAELASADAPAEEDVEVVDQETEEVEIIETQPEEDKEPAKDDHAAWAKMRREKADEKRRADELAQKIAALEAKVAVKPEPVNAKKEDEAPNPDEDMAGYLLYQDKKNKETIQELKRKLELREQQDQLAQQRQQAIQNFGHIISEFKEKKAPDFDAAAQVVESELHKAIRLQNPLMHQSKVKEMVASEILRIANQFAANGLNPAEEFYSLAHEIGYKKQVAQPQQADVKPVAKQKTLTEIEKVRKRAATGLNAGGATGSQSIGVDILQGITIADFAKLTPSQIRELEAQM